VASPCAAANAAGACVVRRGSERRNRKGARGARRSRPCEVRSGATAQRLPDNLQGQALAPCRAGTSPAPTHRPPKGRGLFPPERRGKAPHPTHEAHLPGASRLRRAGARMGRRARQSLRRGARRLPGLSLREHAVSARNRSRRAYGWVARGVQVRVRTSTSSQGI
jgi:hypothetical protein